LRVQLNGVADGEVVQLESNQGGLTGSSVASDGCEPVIDCKATFGALNVPSLGGTLMHDITVSFSDRAGNAATAVTPRGDETIYARTDVLAPATVQPIVCIGESTTPDGVDPPSDPLTYEDPACTAACAASGAECDRRGGKATLTWDAPDEDGASGGAVAGYEIVVAALAVNYPDSSGTDYTSCSALDADGDVEQRVSVTTAAQPGEPESATIVDLYPHRSYCFAVLAIDDVGNRAELGTSVVERTIPLVDYPDIVAFDPTNQEDDAAGAMYTAPDTGLFLGHQLTAVGDLDGDTRDDFAASRLGAVLVFLSGDGLDEPAVTVSAPTAGGAGLFGFSVAGGDFNDDGRSDLAICSQGLTTSGGPNSGTNGGAVFLYYGVATTGIRRDVNAGGGSLPSPFPDVALFGPANAGLCQTVLLDDVDGRAGADLLIGTTIQGQVCDSSGLNCVVDPKVYGFSGSRNPLRFPFPTTPPADRVEIHLNLSSPAGCGTTECADFSLSRRADGGGSFPWAMATADVNGDGVNDLAVSDQLANHPGGVCDACGEVYVYSGGAGLSGPISPPDTDPAQLLHILRYVSGRGNFGQTLLGVPAPRAPSDGADWLLVHVGAGNGRIVVFEATALGGTPGIDPADYPPGGLTGGSSAYTELDRTTWRGAVPTNYGSSMAVLGAFDGHGGVDIAVGPGLVFAAHPTFLYSFDSDVDGFVKRVMFIGSSNFGAGSAGVSYLDSAAGGATQFAISSPGKDAIHLFR
jgi:hypothetical protein